MSYHNGYVYIPAKSENKERKRERKKERKRETVRLKFN